MTSASVLIVAALGWTLLTTPSPAPIPAGDASSRPAESPEELVRSFLDQVAVSEQYPETARRFVAEEWARRRGPERSGTFVHDALAVLSPEFKEALDAIARPDRAASGLPALKRMSNDVDPYLAVASSYFGAQSLVEQRRVAEADTWLSAMAAARSDWAVRSPVAAELTFLQGYCALEMLRYDDAVRHLERFVQSYAYAPERMRQAARQMLQELAVRVPGQLGDVHDLMSFSERELDLGRSDDGVRARQAEAVALLDKLIQAAEDQEKNNSGQNSGASGTPQGAAPQNQPGAVPAARSTLPGGPPGDAGELHDAPRARPGAEWGQMPAKQREAMLQALQQQFPSQYRDLVEQYYKQLAKEEDSEP